MLVTDYVNRNFTDAKISKCSEKGCSKNKSFIFYHLILFKRWHPSAFRVISNKRVTIKGKRYNIIPKRCGISFSDVISGLK